MKDKKFLLRLFLISALSAIAVLAYAVGFKNGVDVGKEVVKTDTVWYNTKFISSNEKP